MNEEIQVNEILHDGAISVVNLEYSVSQNFESVFHEFAIHPTGNGPKPPVAMFVTDVIRVRRGTKSNFLVMEHKVGNGAFYFGLIFSSVEKVKRFLEFLIETKVVAEILHSDKIEAITAKLFENYQ